MSSNISQAFDEITSLTRAIELSATHYDGEDNNTAIDTLQGIISYQEDSPEGRGNANEAREALDALQAAAKLLIANLRGV